MPYDDDLLGLVGEELSAVAFVRDYVEFIFDGPVLRALTNPVFEADGLRVQFPDPGSRDALCSLIGAMVRELTIRYDDRIELRIDGGHTLTIPLDAASRLGPEAAHYVPAAADGSLRVEDMLIW
jgi:hypothetical protein